MAMFVLCPEPIRHTRCSSACSASSLICSSLADCGCSKRWKSRVRISSHHSTAACVNHYSYAGNRDRGFGQAGREHHSALLSVVALNDLLLFGGRERAVKLTNNHRSRPRSQTFEHAGDSKDLGSTWKKNQNVSRVSSQRLLNDFRYSLLERIMRRTWPVASLDGVHLGHCFDHRRRNRWGSL
ncbi:unannotated protein [freshwater metagenome]|uniref:Unannotated protein n=1 Tax=freshwater metagenome TaxID=449393 RepID=A0A6J6Y910_9ZZZZ